MVTNYWEGYFSLIVLPEINFLLPAFLGRIFSSSLFSESTALLGSWLNIRTSVLLPTLWLPMCHLHASPFVVQEGNGSWSNRKLSSGFSDFSVLGLWGFPFHA